MQPFTRLRTDTRHLTVLPTPPHELTDEERTEALARVARMTAPRAKGKVQRLRPFDRSPW